MKFDIVNVNDHFIEVSVLRCCLHLKWMQFYSDVLVLWKQSTSFDMTHKVNFSCTI